MDKPIEKSADRLEVLKKIEEYEKKGLFDIDVELDPPSKPLYPDQIEYVKKTPIQKLKTFIAFRTAYAFLKKAIKQKKLILNEIKGAENLSAVKGGAILTCNHFNPYDSFVMQLIYDKSKHKNKMYRIIREGNYTSFGGYYGFLMRNCNTLPLSSKKATMLKFLRGVDELIKKGNCVLIYPEQSMWWNYRKPKPLKPGAFDIAVRNNVPVVPCFIALTDSDIVGEDGFFVQEYTPIMGKPIYPDESLSKTERRDKMLKENYEFFKNTYEDFYKIPLEYLK